MPAAPPEDPHGRLPALGANRRRASPTLLIGLAMAALAVLAAALAPLLAPHDPTAITPALLSGPSAANPFGTDELGRDILSRVLYAARVSLAVAFGSVGAALVIGGAIGIAAGYLGGWVDAITMRLLDVLLAFPAILFAVALVSALGPSVRNLMLTIAVLYTPRFARVGRGPTLQVKRRDFVTGAEALGGTRLHIMRAHILPNVASPLIVEASLSLTIALLTEAALSFLGLGVQPPDPSWGGMISAGRPYLLQAPWTVIFPGLAIMYAVLSFNLIGDGLRDTLDPHEA